MDDELRESFYSKFPFQLLSGKKNTNIIFKGKNLKPFKIKK